MIWQLVICGGLSWGGCGFVSVSDLPRDDCFSALAVVRFDEHAVGDDSRSSLAFCRPKAPDVQKEGGASRP